ncbi:NADH:ubiquinone reductase (Na(+)-transporting) subunit B [Terasakiella sp. SH-1]|uniref:NADH:ubiquinone reductase (Na(+)-transporting) subunit B n=1 Tax=Terasakiella sp. SH-1 TaxID=2560057 RepID=UPI001073A3F4|nr:NADH:ubiquinone reductase (Na(+)-transporting) subunit B [Terasakiella sp. SH-1]
MGLRNFFDSMHHHFDVGGKYEKYYALYEMVDTFLYSPKDVTYKAPHARDHLDLKRLMSYVVVAAIPCILFAMYNTGLQTNMALQTVGQANPDTVQGFILNMFGIGFDPNSFIANMFHGFLYFLPIYVVTLVVGGLWEVLFAMVRGHEVNEGFLVTSMLYTLILPPTTPLWQVALGISFGVVIGKEVFGGTGKNFLNPALVGRAFLYFAYPASQSGDSVWVPVDGYSGATALSIANEKGFAALPEAGITWMDAFLGFIPGSLGETSALAAFMGGAFLIFAKIANYRLIAGCLLGMIGTSLLFNTIGSDTNPMFAMPWYWHLVIGGYAFGLIFMVTEPVSGAMTNKGRWVYGALIGVMVVLIRVVNPAFPEGMMLAILFGNIFAPLIDHFVVKANIKRRLSRNV